MRSRKEQAHKRPMTAYAGRPYTGELAPPARRIRGTSDPGDGNSATHTRLRRAVGENSKPHRHSPTVSEGLAGAPVALRTTGSPPGCSAAQAYAHGRGASCSRWMTSAAGLSDTHGSIVRRPTHGTVRVRTYHPRRGWPFPGPQAVSPHAARANAAQRPAPAGRGYGQGSLSRATWRAGSSASPTCNLALLARLLPEVSDVQEDAGE